MTTIDNRPSATEAAPECHVIMVTASNELANRVSQALTAADTSIAIFASAEELEPLAFPPDMLVLDAATPDVVAPATLKKLRRRWPGVLLIAMSVPDEDTATRVLGEGVDDAIENRSSWSVVSARLNAAARRTRAANAQLRRRMGDVVYDRDNRRVWCAGTEVEFAPRELAVLDALWVRAGSLVRHDSLHDFVWAGVEEKERSNRLEVYISYIRRKLQRSNEVTIQTLRGAGYRLVRKSATETPWEQDEPKDS